MITANRKNAVFAAVILSLTLLLASPALAKKHKNNKKQNHTPSAKSHKSKHGGYKKHHKSPRRRKDRRGYRRHKDRDDSFTLGFGWHSPSYYSSTKHWVSGHYETRTERVLVEPAHYEFQTQRILVEPAHYEYRQIPAVKKIVSNKRGKLRKVIVVPARTEKTWVPDRYETREVKIWVPAQYETHQVRVWVPGYWVSRRVQTPSRSWLNLGGVFRFKF